ncbi:RNA-binding domain-containing protein [Tundrisphaera lichenicola]|uniref:RNA-binding domain-containing protein n=1 Tax=Tundrisphaera lichenicola TaxID=2029860 RepID=UPI003EC03CC1
MNGSDFERLLMRMEGESIDFKSDNYPNLSDEAKKIGFIKDIICMVNTPREGPAYIVTGVKKSTNGQPQLKGVSAHPDDADLQSQFAKWVQPHPRFSYEVVQFQGREFGVIVIPEDQSGPCYPIQEHGNVLKLKKLYFRRGSQNDAAAPDECHRIISWFESAGRSAGPPADESDLPWGEFCESVWRFDPSRRYVLFTTPLGEAEASSLSALGFYPWTAVFDLDPGSDRTGLLKAVMPSLESRRSLHLVTRGQDPLSDPSRGTVWFFARGLEGRPNSLVPEDRKKWRGMYRKEIEKQLDRISSEVSPAPITCVVLAYGSEYSDYLKYVLEWSGDVFQEAADYTIVTDVRDVMEDMAQDIGARLFTIPIAQLGHGLARLAPGRDASGDREIELPSSSGVPITPPAIELRWLEEELDLVCMSTSELPPNGREVGKDFLRGAPIAWCDLANHIDVERTKTGILKRIVDTELKRRPAVRINLYHAAGAGGTTLAHRMLWDFRHSYPCAILLRTTSPSETANRLDYLASQTGLCVLLLVDGARVAERQFDELYNHVSSRHLPVKFLQTVRRQEAQEDRKRTVYLASELDSTELNRFVVAFSREVPDRQRELEALAHVPERYKHTAFYFGLQAFGQDFLGLEPYVRERLSPLSEVQREIVGFTALAHHYAQRTIPQQAFAASLGVARNRSVRLDDGVLPPATRELLVEVDEDGGAWRPSHELIALEILVQLLAPGGGDRRIWKQRLSVWAIRFAEFCRGDDPVPGGELLEVARRAFVYRDNRDDLGTERSAAAKFSKLISDIPALEGQLECLRKLVELYPDEAHFLAHLGRFYYLVQKDYVLAIETIDRAIARQREDHLLHHMRGMAVRSQLYQVLQEKKSISEAVALAKIASDSFQKARELAPDDVHGYISETQMLIRLLDFCGANFLGGMLGYLASKDADRDIRDALDRAEDLLDQVHRFREGEDPDYYEERCRADLDRLHGRTESALQVWDSLLSRKGVYQPSVRRSIVWTYLARCQHCWEDLRPKEADRIVHLLGQNMNEEADNDKDLRLWVRAVRRVSSPPSIESVIERIAYWRANTGSLDASYYLYVLKAIQAIEGSTLALDESLRFLEECRKKAQFRRNRTISFEWLGLQSGLASLVHQSSLGQWLKEADFWENVEPLARIGGRIAEIKTPQAGSIDLECGLKAFFVPAKGGYSRGHSENRPVTFYLGFSYDGLRAWSVKNPE